MIDVNLHLIAVSSLFEPHERRNRLCDGLHLVGVVVVVVVVVAVVVLARLLLEPNVASTLPELLLNVGWVLAALDALVALLLVDAVAMRAVGDVGVVDGSHDGCWFERLNACWASIPL